MPEFLECCLKHLSDCRHSYLTRVPIMNTQGGNKYSVRIGDQTTIYLGATTSDKLLRIYDKKAQYTKDGLWKENNPYMDNDDCKSWFRIELQTRQKKLVLFLLLIYKILLMIIAKTFLYRLCDIFMIIIALGI